MTGRCLGLGEGGWGHFDVSNDIRSPVVRESSIKWKTDSFERMKGRMDGSRDECSKNYLLMLSFVLTDMPAAAAAVMMTTDDDDTDSRSRRC